MNAAEILARLDQHAVMRIGQVRINGCDESGPYEFVALSGTEARESAALIRELQKRIGELTDQSESWRLAHQRWQRWARELCKRHGWQPDFGELGDETTMGKIGRELDKL